MARAARECTVIGLTKFPIALILIITCGCASYPLNEPLDQIDTDVGYRLNNRTLGEKNSDSLYVIVSLSGGGMRAAALDYGVLKYLNTIRFGEDDRSLLDEVDLISTSSAASIPAAYYGLFGKEVFLNDFVEDVLYRNMQSDLIKRGLNPVHWPRLMSGKFSRGDLAAEYLDQHIFDGLTFADMSAARPVIMLNATDMGIGSQLSFVQSNFDVLCSDLSPYLVSRAVTASMAFTPGFTPITLKNYEQSTCGYVTPKWVKNALMAGFETQPLVYSAARDVVSYENVERRPYIHLLDSGISDNIGIRTPALLFAVPDAPASQLDRVNDGTIEKLVIILVDAKPETWFAGDLKPKPPGAITSVNTAASNPLANYSYETVSRLKQSIREDRKETMRFYANRKHCDAHSRDACNKMGTPDNCFEDVARSCYDRFKLNDENQPNNPEIYLLHIGFELLDDDQERENFQTIPTSLQLPREDVDALIDVAPKLIKKTPDFYLLLQDLDAEYED